MSRYQDVVFDAIPAGCTRAIDVGCGTGALTRELRRRGIPEVVGLDRDERCIEICRAHAEAGEYVVGDLSTVRLEPAGLVTAVASLHHVDAREGLTKLKSLVAEQGVLVVVGLARPDFPKDLPREIAAQAVGRFRKGPEHKDEAPTVWPPPERYSTMRRLATELLPGVRWKRHLLWRYSLVWSNS